MFFVWVIVAAFLIGWGTNIGVLSIDQEKSLQERLILGMAQVVLIALGLMVYHLA